MTHKVIVLVLGMLGALGSATAFAQSTEPEPAPGQSSTPATTSPGTTPAAAQTPATAKTQAEEAKAVFEAQKAAFDAQKSANDSKKAAYEAEAAQKAAKNGTVTGQTTITGAIQVGTEGPKAEALLLASRAALSAAKIVRGDLEGVFRTPPYSDRRVLIVTSEDQLTSAASTAYDIRRALLKSQLDDAHRRFQLVTSQDYIAPPPKAANASQNRMALLPALSVADQVIGDIAKIGSWFQSDYSFGQVTVEATSDLYAAAIVRSFRDSTVVHPAFYSPTHLVGAEVKDLVAELTDLQQSFTTAATDQAIALKLAADRRAQAAEDKDNAGKLLAAAGRYEAYAAATGRVVDATETFLTALFTETAEKPALIIRIAQEREVQRRLRLDPLVLLVTGKPVGAYYTRKNMWTFLGGPPLYTMGGANIVYKLFDPDTGFEVTHGVVPVHGGYRSVDKVERLFPAP
jgi:hypothetical protein